MTSPQGYMANVTLKFGLNVPKKQTKAPVAKKPIPSIFKLDDDEPVLDMNTQIKMEAERKKKQLKNQEIQQKILEEDPTAYDYDGVYDIMQQQRGDRVARLAAAKELDKKKPKYIDAIKERAAQREIEQGIIFDRMQRKEQEKDVQEFGDLPKFVTSAYKQKLIRDKQWLEEEAEREAREGDVTKQTDMSGFYTGLFTKNVAFGAETSNEIKSKKKVKEEERKKKLEEERIKKEKEEEIARKKAMLTDEERMRIEIRKELEAKEEEELKNKTQEEIEAEKEKRRKERAEELKRKDMEEAERKEKEKAEKEELEKKKLARRNDEQSISDARARYLARKAAVEQSQAPQ
eukprot:TRINITY_DN4694_c0_g1_i1.p1 TRINITY_DN4694_c0_g1~~TRINITY_DN4694_c0_g1_i1.p1  ORF type:complete len:347 (+),score=161.21 TRINITY_DN4694_c0_g1_i1:44-1084(+)